MALVMADNVIETTTTTGTGALALAGAITGFQAFDDVCANNDTCYYSLYAVDANGNRSGAWECGLGTFTDTDTLTRTTVHASSNAGAAVNLAAGTKHVQLDATAAFLATKAAAANKNAAQPLTFNFTAAGDAYFYADEAMTLTQQATTGAGGITYEKGTTAAPDTFTSTSSPISLQAGAWLKVTADAAVAVHLKRTA